MHGQQKLIERRLVVTQLFACKTKQFNLARFFKPSKVERITVNVSYSFQTSYSDYTLLSLVMIRSIRERALNTLRTVSCLQSNRETLETETLWGLLPAKNLQLIFDYCDIFDVEKCLLVCKHWNHEANFYLKDKVALIPAKVFHIEELKVSRRKFQIVFVDISTSFRYPDRMGLCPSDREVEVIIDVLNLIPNITEARITFTRDDIKTLYKIIQLLGKTLTSLKLELNESEFCGNPLTVYGNMEPLHICRNLKTLVLTNYDIPILYMFGAKLLKTFFSENASVETLCIDSDLNKDLLNEINKLKNLKNLQLGLLSRIEDTRAICSNLQHLTSIAFKLNSYDVDPSIIRDLFSSLSKATKFEIDGGYTNQQFSWKQVFLNLNNTTVTYLNLRGSRLDEDSVSACIETFPNISSFTLQSPANFGSRVFQEMSEKWRNLESLNIDVGTKNLDSEKNLFNFPKLVKLTLKSYKVHRILRATNLIFLILIDYKFPTTNEPLEQICVNFPKMRFLHIIASPLQPCNWLIHNNLEDDILKLEAIRKIRNRNLIVVLGKLNIIHRTSVLEEFCKQNGATIESSYDIASLLSRFTKRDIVRRILIDDKEIFWKIRKY